MKQIYAINNLEVLHVHNENTVTKDIIFFRNRHKHILEIKTSMQLYDDEVLDNYLFRKYIEQITAKINFDINDKSYDMLALHIRKNVIEKFTNHNIIIEIKEDNNNGYIYNWDELEPVLEEP